MKTQRWIFHILWMCLLQHAYGQIYTLPFSSKNNTIELAVVNSSPVTTSNVQVRIADPPSWLKFSTTNVALNRLNANEEKSAVFGFTVDKLAPVNKEQTLSFVITTKTGELWTKELKIAVAAPERFELFQNYPNPFNPATVISYQLTAVSNVSLKVYNILGQEVSTLVEGQQEAGYHEAAFDASRLASGIYVYQIHASDDKGNHQVGRKKMLVLK